MHTSRTSPGTLSQWPRLLAILALVLCLVVPATAGAQGIKDRPADDDEPATEETTDDEEPATEEATDDDEPADESQDPEDAGLIDDQSYESPQFGYTLEWSADWEVDTYYDDQPEGPSVNSDPENEIDQIYLMWTGGPDEYSYAIFSGQTANRGGPEGDVAEWTDEDYIDEQWNPVFDVDVLADDTNDLSGAVFFSVLDTENGTQYYTLYQSIELEDGTTLYVTFSGFEDWFEASYTSFAEDIALNGDPIELVFTPEDLSEVIAEQ